MTVRRILPWPHACLRTPAAQVAEINDEIRALWDDMIDTMGRAGRTADRSVAAGRRCRCLASAGQADPLGKPCRHRRFGDHE